MTAKPAGRFAIGILLGYLAIPAQAATPEDARRAYDAGRFTDAMGIWADLSRQGSAEAAFGIGLLYDLGNGTPEDPEAALFWYNTAARAGLPEAEFNIGAMYDAGRGVAKDTAEAALWYARAAARGHHRAQFDLGQLYEQGDGVPRNPDAAAAWYHDAADGGITAASVRLKALHAKAQAQVNADLAGAIPAFPDKNATLALTSANPVVELVWIAQPKARPVRYEVSVGELEDTMRIIFTATTTETAALIRLPETEAFYVWHVDAIEPDGARQKGDWSWFSIANPTAPSQQSMASPRQASQTDR